MAKVELTPLRPWDDFFPGSERFAKPDIHDLPKWNNRVVSNLLYYQTNYLAMAVVVFLAVGSPTSRVESPLYIGSAVSYVCTAFMDLFVRGLLFMYPIGMFTGAAVVVAVFLGAVWAADNKAIIKNFKKDNPALFVFLVIFASYLLMSLFGGVMVFLLGIKLPLILIFAHASLRLRNMKNKLENKMESAGLKKSPMGILLEALGQQEENLSKVQEFLENKLKE